MLKLTDKEFLELTTYVKRNYGINLTQKRTLIEGRLSNTLIRNGYKSFSEYFQTLYADKTGNEMTMLLNKLTTNYTYFMRENEHFEYMTKTVLPYLERTCKNKTMYIWSSACSSGQEPYSMAMAIADYFGPRKGDWNTVILASDLSENVLQKAMDAVYTQEEIKDIPPKWVKKYLVNLKNGSYRISDSIRKEVVFRKVNLMDPFHFKHKFNLIFCRNVMIYFDGPTKDKLINQFYNWSENGAYLFIGHSESINKDATQYKYVQPSIFQKRV